MADLQNSQWSKQIDSDSLVLSLATPTPLRTVRKPYKGLKAKKIALKPQFEQPGDIEGPSSSIPQKRRRPDNEQEDIELIRTSPAISSIFGTYTPKSVPRSILTTTEPVVPSIIDFQKLIKEAISPLTEEIKGLRAEIKELRAKTPIAQKEQGTNKPKAASATQKPAASKAASIPRTETPKDSIPAKPTYASVLYREPIQQQISKSATSAP